MKAGSTVTSNQRRRNRRADKFFWQRIFSRMSLGLIKLRALVGCNETLPHEGALAHSSQDYVPWLRAREPLTHPAG